MKTNQQTENNLEPFVFFRAETSVEKEAIDRFLLRHNSRGFGSTAGYRAYYAATYPADGRPLIERLVAAAKFCPLHTPSAAKFFAGPGEEWRHVYCLQRLAAARAPRNLLSKFLAWCFKDIGKDPKVWYVATYADTGCYGPDGRTPHSGTIYRALGMTYCGLTRGGGIEGYKIEGRYRSLRKGGRTLGRSDIPAGAEIIRGKPKHRYCKAVGPPLARMFRQRALDRRMAQYIFDPAYQPRLLCRWLKQGVPIFDFLLKGGGAYEYETT